MRDEDALCGLLREPVECAPQADSAIPPALREAAPVPARRADAQAVDPLALDAVAAEHDVAGHERPVAAQRVRGLADRVAQGRWQSRRPGTTPSSAA